LRYLCISHGHPDLSPGGGERAAHALFGHLDVRPDVEALFVARADHRHIGHGARFRLMDGKPNEVLASPPPVDHFTLLSRDLRLLDEMIGEIVDMHQPTIAHIQHFAFWGVDIVRLLKRRGIPVIMTLHEFLLICHRDGQMLTTSGKLCDKFSPIACANCFPQYSAGQFFVRQKMLLKLLEGVDAFISPSQFLADRFVAWGIDPGRIHVIENPLCAAHLGEADVVAATRPARHSSGRLRLGYFGQVTPYKGVDVLLRAVDALPEKIKEKISVSIYGGLAAGLSDAFQDITLRNETSIEWLGPYASRDAISLMREVDWVVMPSIWWENSPVVLQEAQIAGCGILCSRLGGMAEKARDADLSATFRAGSSQDLARMITQLVEEHADENRNTGPASKSPAHSVGAHKKALDDILAVLRAKDSRRLRS
jgi:glycosyltransferase involved in cell wall biosynthesis